MKQKRGLSDVIVTVITILLALAAIGIVWAFVSATINRSRESIELQSKCLEIELRPISCYKNTSATSPGNITFQLVKGQPNEVIGVVENENLISVFNRTSTENLNVFAVSQVNISGFPPGNEIIATVSAVLKDGETEVICAPTQEIRCL